MENNIKGRLLKFIESRSISVRRFEIECGFPNAYVSNLKRTMTPTRVEALSKRFPELNIVWLMTGSGEMLNTPHTSISPASDTENNIAEMNQRLTTAFEEFVRHETLIGERYIEHINRLTDAYNHTLSMLNAERADISALLSQIANMQQYNAQIQQQNEQLIRMLQNLIASSPKKE
ncbi:MAG: hypothetical protein IIV91_02640 [Alistipes sp.]|jgi:hypothetical protein|nr:hypothetical protein [Alistipes sp.]